MAHTDNELGVPHYWGKTGKTVQKLISTVAIIDFLLFGYDQGVMSGIISSPQFRDDFPVAGLGTASSDASTWQAFITAIYAVGCLFGALAVLGWGDTLGRRKAIFLGAIVMIIGVMIQLTSVPASGKTAATAQLIIGRFITGIGNGINTSTVPTYQAECVLFFLPFPSSPRVDKRGLRAYPQMLPAAQPRQADLHRGRQRRHRDPDCLLDRLRELVRPARLHLALPHRLPVRLCPGRPRAHAAPARVAALAPDARPRRRGQHGAGRPPRRAPPGPGRADPDGRHPGRHHGLGPGRRQDALGRPADGRQGAAPAPHAARRRKPDDAAAERMQCRQCSHSRPPPPPGRRRLEVDAAARPRRHGRSSTTSPSSSKIPSSPATTTLPCSWAAST